MQASLQERLPIRQNKDYRCYSFNIYMKLLLSLIWYTHGKIISLSQEKYSIAKRTIHERWAVHNSDSYAGKCQYKIKKQKFPELYVDIHP